MGLLDRDIVAARPTITAPTPTVSAAQTTYEQRTGDLGNVVSPASYTQPTVQITAPTPVTAAPTPTTTPTVTPDVPEIVATEEADAAVVEAADPTGAFADSLAKFTEQDIQAALAAIEAEFGLTRAELMRDQTMIGAQFRLLTAQLARQQEKALGQAEAGALQRGLFRSGIYAAEAGEVGQQFAEKQAEFQTAADAQQLAITERLGSLTAEQATAQAQEETAIRRGEYTARLQAAGL